LVAVEFFAFLSEADMKTYRLNQWLEMRGYSRAFFYKLAAQGLAPRTVKVGRTVTITEEADREWLAAHEVAA
jgi:predicted DNA-binding transcriptional regulator AlpA